MQDLKPVESGQEEGGRRLLKIDGGRWVRWGEGGSGQWIQGGADLAQTASLSANKQGLHGPTATNSRHAAGKAIGLGEVGTPARRGWRRCGSFLGARRLNSGVGGSANGGLCWRLADRGDADRRRPIRRWVPR